ncbi:MAG TPA: ribonucleoside-diphosphate reductase subunit alpha [Methylomirabilota bacterium]|nr:ribonucleoside-diphosphate reductase subunit alpha [Methylomirabilota bacterium]
MLQELDGQLRLTQLDPLAQRQFHVRKRDGRVVPFDETRIALAIEATFKADASLHPDQPLPAAAQDNVIRVANAVIRAALAHAVKGDAVEIEFIQDLVETKLMEAGHHSAARRFILYREERRKARALRGDRTMDGAPQSQLFVTLPDQSRELLDPQRIRRRLISACRGLEQSCSARELADEALKNLYDGVRPEEIEQAMILAARSRIEREPDYTFVAARLLLRKIYREALPAFRTPAELAERHREHFGDYLAFGTRVGRLAPELLDFDLAGLAAALRLDRDQPFTYMGVQTLYDRYLIHHEGRRLETPQYFWMRVAMGLALNEGAQKNERAIEFYEVLSTFRFVSSTPTLFNAGTVHPQLSSCYLSTVADDLDHIFKVISDNARLSKWAGGLGNDWTNIRATGAHIKGTNGTSQGVIPFLKVANDTAVAVNQGGKRKGALCAYLETWHLDIEDFLELRKNTGDERRRTHDMNTANWIPDLFMQRVKSNGHWTLFNPSDVPDLHDLYGRAFAERYEYYEREADAGRIKLFKRVEAVALWRKMLTLLFETGHPWITFKDPSNIRSPQSHVGVVHSSNLCTEILLNTSVEETAVCNLGSVNLAAHVLPPRGTEDRAAGRRFSEEQPPVTCGVSVCHTLDADLLARTIRTGMRMLDNVIDINFYPTPEARAANVRHRPVGLGLMGFQDAIYKLRIPYDSEAAVEFADASMELISYHALLASTELARERGAYPTFKGSKWDQGLLPIDTLELLARERGGALDVDRSSRLDWTPVREAIRRHGLRNSNSMAIAPTATISNIIGVSQSIEPTYKHLFAKANLSGDFTTANRYLVADLKRLGLWDDEMVDDLKYYDGVISDIERIPAELRRLYRTAFEIEPKWLIECASRRQKWIDMGQSLNLYIARPSGRQLSEMYLLAWEKGLKTTYYLRSLAATQIEKSTTDVNRRGLQPRWMKSKSASAEIQVRREYTPEEKAACSLEVRRNGGECEACQ